MKRLSYLLASVLRLPALFRFFHKNSLTIVLYHGVAPGRNAGLSARAGIYNYRGKFIESGVFERQMRYFKKHYSLLPLEEAVQRLRSGTLPPYALAVTFDDGYRNFFEHAYPVLKKMRVPATMFLATDFVFGKKPLWVDRLEYALGKEGGTREERAARDARIRAEMKKLPDGEREKRLGGIERGAAFTDFADERAVYAPLSEEEIRTMQKDGFSFGAHTKSHPILSRVPEERLPDEIGGSKKVIAERLGTVSEVFAYPNGQAGDWNEAAEHAAREAGCIAALSTVEGFNTKNTHPMRLRRIAMDGTDDVTFALVASGMRAWLRDLLSYVR